MRKNWSGVKKKTMGQSVAALPASEQGSSGDALALVPAASLGPPPGKPKYLTFVLPESGATAKMELLWREARDVSTPNPRV